MDIQPIVIGTAGHIDHGKSTLVRALTGVNPDRLKEELERGLTIDLGFAPLEMPDGKLVGIVDVPGHEKFVRNMVAGATGIDLVVLVVAADDGVMPQTIEHLQIMEVLGVQHGIVALTKVDMVDPELADMAEEDVRTHVADTFLRDAPIVRVSALSGEGMDELKRVLFELTAKVKPRSNEGIFRMPVQRVFSRKGFGTVVTGIPVTGEAKVGDTLEVLPAGVRAKVRGLNAYKQSTDMVRAGHSSAINFSDLDQKDVARGSIIAAPGFFEARKLVGARFQVLRGLTRTAGVGAKVSNRMAIRFHTGTADPPGELILLDADELAPGETGLVQIRLADSVVVAPGDRFVLRQLSPVATLGGGIVLEESRFRLKRYKNFILEELTRQESSLDDPRELLSSMLQRRGKRLISLDELSHAVKRPTSEVERLLNDLKSQKRAVSPKASRWIHAEQLHEARKHVETALTEWFEAEAHRTTVDVLELRSSTKLEDDVLRTVLKVLEEEGSIEVLSGGKIRTRTRKVELPPEMARAAEQVKQALDQGAFKPPLQGELMTLTKLAEAKLQPILQHLIDSDEIVHIGADMYLSKSHVVRVREAVVENCTRNGNLVLPELRTSIGTSRKYLIPILEHFDGQGLTLRQGAQRILKRR